MSDRFMFEKPLGMRDTIPVLYEAKQKVRQAVLAEMSGWGYRMIETPALEYYETIGEASAIEDRQLFKLLDQQGYTLVLRPDMTTPIARVAASKLLEKTMPVRLAYDAKVYRAQQREGGKPAEFEQIGVECIGDPSIGADAESISLLVSSLQKIGLVDFKISIGHIGFVQDFLVDVLGTEARAEQCRTFLVGKNYVGFRKHIEELALSTIDRERLYKLLALRGSGDILKEGLTLAEEAGKAVQAIEELSQLWEQLQAHGVDAYVQFDLALVPAMHYYTGLLYEVYAAGVGMPIGNGGRYDQLLSRFGRNAPATGFALLVDRLLEAQGDLWVEQPSSCVLYSKERLAEAIRRTKELRGEGMAVVLQDISSVKELDAFTRTFQDVEYLVGSRKESLL